MKEIIEVIFIGAHFYHKSGSSMSSVYKVNGERYDYGFLQRDLAAGNEVHIRQATPMEREFYERKLVEDNRKWAATREASR